MNAKIGYFCLFSPMVRGMQWTLQRWVGSEEYAYIQMEIDYPDNLSILCLHKIIYL